jgi:hypothetical protein
MRRLIPVAFGCLLLAVGVLAGTVSAPRYELLLAISLLAEVGAIACFLVAAKGASRAARGLLIVGTLLAGLVISDALSRMWSGWSGLGWM